ncbi:hypothetical protein [Pararhodobacter sp.]|uniref:hypothetical protein n=1 Tax=Pararhodobacter sp. TaxID=2127056 RepID=UPI002AFE5983|nr:hypothetical protein [Pararhodobacter sp.]
MNKPARPWSLRKRLTRRVLGLVIGGWLVTIVLSVFMLEHEMNDMFDEELTALVETSVLFLESSDTARVPRNLGGRDGSIRAHPALAVADRSAPSSPVAGPDGRRLSRHTRLAGVATQRRRYGDRGRAIDL